MTAYTVKTGWDASCYSTSPNTVRSGIRYLSVSDERQAFVWLRVPGVTRDTLQVGRLRFVVRGDFPGSATLTARRINESWKTSTITWNNRPSVVTSGPWDVELAVSDLHVGDVIEFDVTNQIASAIKGLPYYGIRIDSDSATPLYLGAFEGGQGPQLYVEAGQAPATPSGLTPADGTISLAKWVCSADFVDHVGDTDLAAMRVQVDAAADGDSPDFDSGAVSVDAPELDLADTAYTGLASGATTQWRCQFVDGAGYVSGWSEWVSVTNTAKPTLTITNPTGGVVGTPTPTITATMTGAVDYRVIITSASDYSDVRYDSYRRAVNGDGSISLEIPETWRGRRVLADDNTYRLVVRGWDEEDRVASVGDPTYAQASLTFAMDDDDGETAIDSLAAAQDGIRPAVVLSWHRATQPDSFVIYRDGKVVGLVDAADVVQSGGTTYAWTDVGVGGYRPHTWRVHAITDGVRSVRATVTATIQPEGVWLLSLDNSLAVQLWETSAVDQLSNSDQAGVYDVVGRRFPTRIVTALGGRAGAGMEFAIRDDRASEGSRTWEDYEADMLAIKADPTSEYRYIAGPDNLLVSIGNVTVTTRSDMLSHHVVRLVRFDLRQVGEFEYGGKV